MDKPIPKNPLQKAESVLQNIDPIGKTEPIPRKTSDNWSIEVHPHLVVKSRFSYQLTINKRVRVNPSPIDEQHPNLFGCFGSQQEAYDAGLEEVEHE
jgi:hypothetical protein